MTIETGEREEIGQIGKRLASALERDDTPRLPGGIEIELAESFFGAEGAEERLRSRLEEEGGLLLLEVEEEHKLRALDVLGIALEGPTDWLFLGARREGDGRLTYLITDIADGLGSEVTSSDALGSGSSDEARLSATPAPLEAEAEAPKEAGEPAAKRPLERFCEAVAATLRAAASEASEYPPDLVRERWVYTVQYPWRCDARPSWEGFTPRFQNTHGTVTYVIEGFLDEAASGHFQWLYLQSVGFWTTDGINQNRHIERGWGTGMLGVNVPVPAGFKFVKSSPANVNNQQTVTTNLGFTVGYKSGNFQFSRSTTRTIRDWRVVLQNFNRWMFAQESPFNGATGGFPNDAIRYNASPPRHEVKSWPDLTRTVSNFDTMSVWRNERVTRGVVHLQPAIRCQYNYIALKNQWPSWKGRWWAWSWNRAFSSHHNLRVDLSRVTR